MELSSKSSAYIFVKREYIVKTIVLAWPIILGQLGTILMGFTDVLFVGKLGHDKIAAAGAANSVYFFISVLGIGIMLAVSALVARYRGEGSDNKIGNVLPATIITAVVSGVVFTIILLVLANNFWWFQQNPQITQLATNYLRIWAFSTLPLLLIIGFKCFCDGLEHTKAGMYITFGGLALNCLLNYILIWGHLGLPELGFEGSAWATFITRCVMAVASLIYILKASGVQKYFKWNNIINFSEVSNILKLGIPTGLQYLFEVGAFAGAALLMGNISVVSGAAHQVALQLAAVTYMVSTGVSAAGSIMTGNAYGRHNQKDIYESGKANLMIILFFMLFTAAVFILFRWQLPLIFTDDMDVISLSASLLFMAALFQLSDGAQCVALGILRGINDTRVPTVVTLISYWVIGLPIAYILAFHYNFGAVGIWTGLSIGLTFSALALNWRFFHLLKKIKFDSIPIL